MHITSWKCVFKGKLGWKEHASRAVFHLSVPRSHFAHQLFTQATKNLFLHAFMSFSVVLGNEDIEAEFWCKTHGWDICLNGGALENSAKDSWFEVEI